MQLHTKILIGLVLGALLGPVMPEINGVSTAVMLEPFGQAFIRLLIMIVIPLVMASLIIGTASLGDLKKLGRIGIKTVGYYLVATALAVAEDGPAASDLGDALRGMEELLGVATRDRHTFDGSAAAIGQLGRHHPEAGAVVGPRQLPCLPI